MSLRVRAAKSGARILLWTGHVEARRRHRPRVPALFQPQGKVRPRPGPSGWGLSVAAPYKLHGGNSATRSLHARNECTKREYAKDVLGPDGAHAGGRVHANAESDGHVAMPRVASRARPDLREAACSSCHHRHHWCQQQRPRHSRCRRGAARWRRVAAVRWASRRLFSARILGRRTAATAPSLTPHPPPA